MKSASSTCSLRRRGPNDEGTRTNSPALRERILRLLHREIDFIPHASFQEMDAERRIVGDGESDDDGGSRWQWMSERAATRAPADMPAHLARLCDADLLSREEELELFRLMNYLKFRANSLRCRLDPDRSSERSVELVERLLSRAEAVRDRLVRSNMRLVISIVKKFVTPQQSFDDLLSEGAMSLLQAVEKFDFSRGFRFSTYAYRAVARNAFRKISDRQKESARFVTGADESLFRSVRDDATSPISDGLADRMRQLLAMFLEQLDRRERFIIRSRYALGAHRRSRTFQYLADKLGVSKERVRQLEQRAVAKLSAMAAQAGCDELRELAPLSTVE